MLSLYTSKSEYSQPFTLPRGSYALACPHSTPKALRSQCLALVKEGDPIPELGFMAYLCVGDAEAGPYNTLKLPQDFEYLEYEDVVLIAPKENRFHVIYRRKSPSNSLLLTERCNHYCVMCSQPPRDIDDSQIADDLMDAIPLMSPATRELGLTGGEPTLTGQRFFDIIRNIKNHLPDTAIHVLSNGRTFADPEMAKKVSAIEHRDIMFGIPLYSSNPDIHNFVVQAENAFDETIRGILNLKNHGVKVEIRVVLHRYTIPSLVELAKYIVTNLSFVDHVAFMGLEAMGFAKSNWNDLWIHPQDYQAELVEACSLVAGNGNRTSVYNLPLCWLDARLQPYYTNSISDWKNDYLKPCETCAAASTCGGFFSSNLNGRVQEDMLKPFNFTEYTSYRDGSS